MQHIVNQFVLLFAVEPEIVEKQRGNQTNRDYVDSYSESYNRWYTIESIQNMNRRNLSVDLISTLLFNYSRFDSKQNRLIDNMLHRGKVMFMLAVFMPESVLNDIIGYNTMQWNWAVKNEKEIWNTVVSQKDLFSSDLQLIRKYLNDAPFTSPTGIARTTRYVDRNENCGKLYEQK